MCNFIEYKDLQVGFKHILKKVMRSHLKTIDWVQEVVFCKICIKGPLLLIVQKRYFSCKLSTRG